MEFLQAMLLGVIQGLTEFLPVSSSGHLAVMQEALGLEEGRLLMNVALHVGTFGSILVVYRRDLVGLVRGSMGAVVPSAWGRGDDRGASVEDRESLKTSMAVVAATVVTVPIAFILQDRVEHLNYDIAAVGGLLLVSGALLFGTRYLRQGARDVGVVLALAIGFAQGLAVLPGISRSGSTIVMALILGVRRDEAVRFSFLAALPVLVGAMILEGGLEATELVANWPVYLLGAVVSFLVGWLCLKLLISLTARKKLHWFAAYLVPLGLALIVFAR